MNKIESYLAENPEYLDLVARIVDYIEANPKPDNTWIEDEDYQSCFEYSDIPCQPQRLYQLETKGIVKRIFDSNSRTVYVLEDIDEMRRIMSNIIIEDGIRKQMHDFPDSEEDLPEGLFDEVIGYDDVKFLLRRGLTTDKITNFMFLGPPGSAKSVFLLALRDTYRSESEYIMASEGTSAGVMDVMFKSTPMYMLIDEFDDMDKDHQSAFASYTETGIVKETKHDKTRELETNTKTFAAANDKSKLKDNILDRFTVLEFEAYDEDEFVEICEHVLPMKEGKSKEESRYIAEAVWDMEQSGDVRKAIQVARLSRGDPEKIIGVLEDYSGSRFGI